MDPLSALSLSACVVQFVDFTKTLITESKAVYRSASGRTSQIVELSQVVLDLNTISDEVERQFLAVSASPSPSRLASSPLIRICEQCRSITKETQDALARLRAQGSGRFDMAVKSIGVALRGLWDARKIDGLRSQLHDIRQQMLLAMVTCQWQDSNRARASIRGASEQHRDIGNGLGQVNRTMGLMSAQIQEIVAALGTKTDVYQGIMRSHIEDGFLSAENVIMRPLPDGPEEQYLRTVEISVYSALHFKGMANRADAIPGAYRNTFEWIFQTHPEQAQSESTWASLPAWLEQSTDRPYWITGKPGSGKSTLMKFISQDERLRSHLRAWAGTRELVCAFFYAWAAGSELQKQHEGLLRTLLFQIFRQLPHLVPQACPRQFSIAGVFGSNASTDALEWTARDVVEVITNLASQSGESFCLALFIDGLDEFSGDHEELIGLVERLNKYEGVKICVSSRPWNVFLDAFERSPSLQVHQLTKPDIDLFVQGNFKAHRGFNEFKELYPDEAQNIIATIVDKAQGVFLWVSIVVKTLLAGLTDGDDPGDLKASVDMLPEHLSDLYRRIWDSIKPEHIAKGAEYLQLLDVSDGDLPATILWLAYEKNSFELGPINPLFTNKDLVIQTIRRRLSSRTKGILEISSTQSVDYLHRTAADWVKGVWVEVLARSSAKFDPHLLLLKARATVFRPQGVKTPPGHYSTDIRGNMAPVRDELFRCFWHAAMVQETDESTRLLVKVLDHVKTHAISHVQREENWDELGWSVVYKRNRPWPYNCFVGLAAQSAVLPYVRTKVREQPELLQPTRQRISILENAVLGSQYFRTEGAVMSPPEKRIFALTQERRLELVRFLVEKTPPGAHAPGLDLDLHSLALDRLAAIQHDSIDGVEDEEGLSWYWKNITKTIAPIHDKPTTRFPQLQLRNFSWSLPKRLKRS